MLGILRRLAGVDGEIDGLVEDVVLGMTVEGGGDNQQLRGAVGGAEALPDADGISVHKREYGRLDGIAEGL